MPSLDNVSPTTTGRWCVNAQLAVQHHAALGHELSDDLQWSGSTLSGVGRLRLGKAPQYAADEKK